jgi:hypothetical protein
MDSALTTSVRAKILAEEQEWQRPALGQRVGEQVAEVERRLVPALLAQVCPDPVTLSRTWEELWRNMILNARVVWRWFLDVLPVVAGCRLPFGRAIGGPIRDLR